MPDTMSDHLNKISPELQRKLQTVIEETGLAEYQLDSISFKQKPDQQLRGLAPGCSLQCSATGFPPSISCNVVCG